MTKLFKAKASSLLFFSSVTAERPSFSLFVSHSSATEQNVMAAAISAAILRV
jgi:hypothetical protein